MGVGSNNLTEAAVSVGLGNDKHNLTVSIAADQADGFDVYQPDPIIAPDDDGYERTSFSLNGLTTINDNISMNLIARYEEGNSEYDDIYNSGGFDQVDHENYSVKVAAAYQGEKIFSELPDASLCLDLAHARQIDPTMLETWLILKSFSSKYLIKGAFFINK